MGGVVKKVGGVVGGALNTAGSTVGGFLKDPLGSFTNFLGGGGPTSLGNSTNLDLNYGAMIAARNPNMAGNTAMLDKILMDQATGNAPSVAQNMLNMERDKNVANALAMSASARGVNTGLANREAMRAAASANQSAVGQGSLLRAQEQSQAAQNMLSNQAQKDKFTVDLLTGGSSRDAAQGELEEKGKSRKQKGVESLLKGVGEGIGAAAMSDKRNKTDIKDASSDIDSLLEALAPEKFKYKEGSKSKPGAGKGEYAGVMAQDLEKTKLGKSLVKETKDGKVVDYGKGFGMLLAAQARLNERLDELENA